MTCWYHLRDDGIENGSDLPELARLQAEDEAATATPSAPAPPRADRPAEPVPSRRSWGGVLLGAALIVGGGAAALFGKVGQLALSPTRLAAGFSTCVYVASALAVFIDPQCLQIEVIIAPPSKPHHPYGGNHYNLRMAHQNPNNCRCFWQEVGASDAAGNLPPPPGSVPPSPFSN